MIYLSQTADYANQVDNLAGSINKYGASAVILGVFIVLVILLVIGMNNSNKKMIERLVDSNQSYYDTIQKQNAELMQKLMDSEKNSKSYDEKDLASIFIKLNSILKIECRKVQTKLNADSLCIYVLHNGTVATHGLPFFKMSCICEWIRKGSGISSRLREHTGLPLTLFDKLICGLFNNGEYIIDSANIDESNLNMFITGPKVLNCFCSAIYDNENKIMGFIAAEFSYDIQCDETTLKKVKEQLWDLAALVKPVLDYSEFQKVDK